MENSPKPSFLKTIITIGISLIFAVFFMWLAVRGMDVQKIKQTFLRANYFWVFFAAIFGVMAYWFRAIRWNLLLEPLGYKISNSNSFWSISFGYLMNLTIPRSGEVARSTALYGVEKVPVDKSFGTIILERIIDLVCMVGFLGLTLIFKYDAIVSFYEYSLQQKGDSTNKKPGIFDEILYSLGIQNTVDFYFYSKIILILLAVIAIGYLLVYKRDKMINFAKGIFDGILSVFKLRQKGKFIFHTVMIWVCYYFAAYLICFALPETSDFTFTDGFFIIVIGTLGMMIPASGGIGAFHFALKIGIMALFLSMDKSPEEGAEVGLSYAFISHTMQMVIMLVFGVVSIPILARAKRN